ncbi:hypothetical protein BP5796_08868 [Coleophoma crateriformis]|uniref:Uncharacterized protein n=1 Tax=Coleophoma crateriformis TaxID=565419 RepID=A0A3D8R2R5_9HELO|nr:hypothetical protein BP5796_08868 [Coleophoma crateriformis]
MYSLNIGASTEGFVCHMENHSAGFSIFHLAADAGELRIFQFLSEHTNVTKSMLEGRTNKSRHVLNHDSGGITDKKDDDLLVEQLDPELSPLHLASRSSHSDVVAFLLKAGVDIESRDREGQTALQHSLNRGWPDTFELLVSGGANLNTRDNDGTTILMKAAGYGASHIIETITKYGVIDSLARDNDGQTAMHHAINSRNCRSSNRGTRVFKLLVNLGLDFTTLDYSGISPIQVAVLADYKNSFILQHLPQIDTIRSAQYGSILNTAARSGNLTIVTELLKRVPKADMNTYINLHCEHGTPVYAAAIRGDIPIMEKLIHEGAEKDLLGGPLGTSIIGACAMGRVEAVSWLLKHKASLDCVKHDGSSILAKDFAKDHDQLCSLLGRFEASGIQGLDDPLPSKRANPAKIDERMAIIAEQQAQREDDSSFSSDDSYDSDYS